MAANEENQTSTADRFGDLFEVDEQAEDVPTFVVAALGLVAAVLVAASTLSAIEMGHTAIGYSFLAAVSLFLGTVAVFEAGRRFGAGD